MSKFKVGDRVAVYNRHWRITGRIEDINCHGKLFVIEDGYNSCHEESPFSPKQCRRLKRKTRREWWISVHKPGCRYLYSIHSTREEAERTLCSRCNTEAVLVREARSGEGVKNG